MTFECTKVLAPPYLSKKFEFFQRTFYFRAVTFIIWNNLPNNIKDINVLSSFKTEYKRLLLD